MSTLPSENLERRAVEQRERIHRTTLELVAKIDQAKQQLSLEHHVREHFGLVSLIGCSLSAVAGYWFGSVFEHR
jgi:hypothetical protein